VNVWHAILHALTADSGHFYGPTSGWLGLLTYLGAPAVLFRKHNCHVRRCWRLGHHPAGDYLVCRRHHPLVHHKAPRAVDVAASLEDGDEIEWQLDDEQPTRGEVRDEQIEVADTAGMSEEWGTDHGDDDELVERYLRAARPRKMGF